MKYYIKSHKWTKINGFDIWWKPNECGYTKLIAEAGVYSEDDKVNIEKRLSISENEFIPITYELWEDGIKQLDKIHSKYAKYAEQLDKEYSKSVKDLNDSIKANNKKYALMNQVANECQFSK